MRKMLKIKIGVLQVEGTEARKFLHAIVSSDLEKLEIGQSQHSLLLTPAGKLVSTMIIHCKSSELFLCVIEKEMVEIVEQNLKRFLIRTDAAISDVSEKYLGLVGNLEEFDRETTMSIEENHLGQQSLFLALSGRTSQDEFNQGELDAYSELRISFGAVSTSKDLSEEIIPQEANLDKLSVSFEKGCYLGQELVCRIDSREASTPFSFFAIELDPVMEKNDTGAAVLVDGVEIGKLTSARSTEQSSINGIEFGGFNAIARINRKGSAELLSAEFKGAEVKFANGKVSKVKKIEPVSGYFSS